MTSISGRSRERLTAIAKQENLPIGAPLEYDCAQYIHQVPGGRDLQPRVSAGRNAHAAPAGRSARRNSVQVRKDLGYPIMITPHSQFVVTQSAINVVTGERYKHVIDELILFAQGVYGEDSGYRWMDQNLKDKLLSTQRAKELKELGARQRRDIPLKEIREKLGGPGVSDEEFLLRYIMKGVDEIAAMRAAGRPRQYLHGGMPLLTLVAGTRQAQDGALCPRPARRRFAGRAEPSVAASRSRSRCLRSRPERG